MESGARSDGEHRPLDQERLAVDVDALLAGLADRQHLARIVPLVERGGGVDALVALQADQAAAEHAGDRLGGFGLADARRAFQQQRLAERQRQIGGGREAVVGQIIGRAQRPFERLGLSMPTMLPRTAMFCLSAAPAAARRPAP